MPGAGERPGEMERGIGGGGKEGEKEENKITD